MRKPQPFIWSAACAPFASRNFRFRQVAATIVCTDLRHLEAVPRSAMIGHMASQRGSCAELRAEVAHGGRACEVSVVMWVGDNARDDRCMADSELSHFLEMKSKHFDPLCQKLSLRELAMESGPRFAIASAVGSTARVWFEHDRGLCVFALGNTAHAKPACSVDEATRLFPRMRVLEEGEQRLSLAEQAQFVLERWGELEGLFGPERIEITRAQIAEKRA
jgi:hypothetical protein